MTADRHTLPDAARDANRSGAAGATKRGHAGWARRASVAMALLMVACAPSLLGSCTSDDAGAPRAAALRDLPKVGPTPDVAISDSPSTPTPADVARGAIAAPAAGPDPTGGVEAAVVRDPWTWGESAGFILGSANYRIHTTIRDEVLLRDLPRLMEDALDHYTTALGPLPRPRSALRSSIFERRSEWAAYTRRRLPNEAEIYLSIGRGGYTTEGESVLFNIGREDTFIIAVHEGWHQYTQSVFTDRLPTWMEEGVACWMEGHRFRRGSPQPNFLPWRNFERFGELRDAARAQRLVPLADLVRGTPQEALGKGKATLLTYYAQVWALIHFLHDGENGRYRDALRQVVADAAAGTMTARLRQSDRVPREAKRRWGLSGSGRWVVIEYFNPDFEEIAAQYDDFVRTLSTGSVGSRIWRGQSPLDPAPGSAQQPTPSGASRPAPAPAAGR